MSKKPKIEDLCAHHENLYLAYFHTPRVENDRDLELLDQMEALEKKWNRLMKLQSPIASKQEMIGHIKTH